MARDSRARVVGEGPALLAVHGTFAGRRRWDAVPDTLAARFSLHLMDRRGRGLSATGADAPRARALLLARARPRRRGNRRPPGGTHLRDAHAALPGAELVELTGHGHAAMDADPAGFAPVVTSSLGRAS